MVRVLMVWAFCIATSHASADCPTPEPITVWGHTYSRTLMDTLSGGTKECDSQEQPSWLAKINDAPAQKGAQPGLLYCRQIVQSKDPQSEAQRHDCIFWYGHSIEAK